MPTLGEVLVKALTPPQPIPKELLLRGPYTPLKSHDKLWTPAEADFSSPRRELEELYARGRDFENSLYARGRDLERSLASPPGFENSLRPLTLAEQAAQFGKAIQRIPDTITNVTATIRNYRATISDTADRVGTALGNLGPLIVKGLDWLDRHPNARDWPIPPWNFKLYLLARRAYYSQTDYAARAAFLDAIEADHATDNATFLEQLLRPTFEPTPQELGGTRCEWARKPPDEAREWLCKRLKKIRDDQDSLLTAGGANDINDLVGAPPSPETDPELWVFYQSEVEAYRRKIEEILPPKQYEVFLPMEKGLPQHDIAHTTGKAQGTIKKQVWDIRNNPQLRAVGQQLQQQLWWDRRAWEQI